jgi:SAM-dependent methyltransferase
MRLNIGSGQTSVPSWTNIDRSQNIMHGRVPAAKRMLVRVGLLNKDHMQPGDDMVRLDTRKLPYADSSVEAIYSSHTLQHLYLQEAEQVLAECARVLKPGGILRLALPDVEQYARQLVGVGSEAAQDAGRNFNSQLHAYPEKRPTVSTRLGSAVGGRTHRWQPSASLVRQLMISAGLVHVYDREFHRGNLPGLEAIETREDGLFLEGTTMA